MKDAELGILPFLLDRLIDYEPELSREPIQHRLTSIDQAKAMVGRDLEKLLNTKGPVLMPLPSYREVTNSLYTYGISDFTSQSPKNSTVRQRLRQEIERAISLFEPRLKNVTVRLDTQSANERALRFKITGLLVVEPVTEPIVFDTLFDINRGEYLVTK